MKSRAGRHAFILRYLKDHDSADVLDKEFVDAYLADTGAPHDPMPYGAHKCRTLGRDLADMYRHRILARRPVGLVAMAGMGFPRWAYVYRLHESL